MPELRSRTVTHGRNMAGVRALVRASGVSSADDGIAMGHSGMLYATPAQSAGTGAVRALPTD
ncbi:hypothetical protein [Streptomyces violens]|uniref:hypothetical protein n=1 Tax=Streptomyces violens TaxID=66377 RepID=UPI0012FF2F09|nr:hypothetical protein [Streptomyces violens]